MFLAFAEGQGLGGDHLAADKHHHVPRPKQVFLALNSVVICNEFFTYEANRSLYMFNFAIFKQNTFKYV